MKQSQAASKSNSSRGDVRAKADLAVAQIKKQFGEGSIMRLGETPQVTTVNVIPTGSLSLDIALGVGGVPRGRVIEIFGPEGSGKTTLAQAIVANAQKAGGIAAFIDAEHAFDVVYSRKLGVDVDNLLVSQPDTGEQALDIVEVLVRSAAVDVIVIDSVAALVPRAEIEGEMGDAHVGLQARLMSQALRKLAGIVSKTNTCIVFINQIRMKIGVLFGNPETTTGGNALKFYSSVRLDIRRIANLKEGENIIGNRTKVKVVKNKVAPPFRTAEFDIIYGEGISFYGDLVDLGVQAGIVDKSGAWFTYGEEKLGQGRERAKQYLRENPVIATAIEKKVHEHFGVPTPGADGSIEAATPSEARPDGAVGGKPDAVRPTAKVDEKPELVEVGAARDGKTEARDGKPDVRADGKSALKPEPGKTLPGKSGKPAPRPDSRR